MVSILSVGLVVGVDRRTILRELEDAVKGWEWLSENGCRG